MEANALFIIRTTLFLTTALAPQLTGEKKKKKKTASENIWAWPLWRLVRSAGGGCALRRRDSPAGSARSQHTLTSMAVCFHE